MYPRLDYPLLFLTTTAPAFHKLHDTNDDEGDRPDEIGGSPRQDAKIREQESETDDDHEHRQYFMMIASAHFLIVHVLFHIFLINYASSDVTDMA